MLTWLGGGKKMRRLVIPFALAVTSVIAVAAVTKHTDPELSQRWSDKQTEIAKLFDGYDGTFVLFDMNGEKYYRFNAREATERLSPCSTFKILNSLIGLQTGVLSGKDHPIKWDGTKYDVEPWNKDQTLQSAIADSVVWYFQRVASEIGEKRMRQYIHAVGYGNRDISGGLTKFWLGSSLKISANEQVQFLRRLVTNRLPFSTKTTNTVKELIFLKETNTGKLFGKTGSDRENGKDTLGWFVGYVENRDGTYVFATNIRANDGAYGRKARGISEQILSLLGLF